MLRIDPVLHAQVAALVEAQGKSLNTWAEELLQHAIISA